MIAPVHALGRIRKLKTENIAAVREFLLQLQTDICSGIEDLDGSASFITDQWDREEGGMGITRVISDGAVIRERRR
jgi:coproporphyrinogen III oxidase